MLLWWWCRLVTVFLFQFKRWKCPVVIMIIALLILVAAAFVIPFVTTTRDSENGADYLTDGELKATPKCESIHVPGNEPMSFMKSCYQMRR